MAGFSDFAEVAVLDAAFNNTSFAGGATIYMKLHVGDPGDAGTANAATETTRKAVSFGPAGSGAISSDSEVQWTSYPAAEDVTFFSLWDNLTAGNCLFTGTVTANALGIGDTLTFASGDIDLTLD
jgi:hypothetical protein